MKPFSARAAISTGWQLTKKYFIVSLGLILAFTILSALLSWDYNSFISAVLQLVNAIVSIIFSMGMILITLNAVDGEEPYFAAFKETLPRFGSFLLMTIILAIAVSVPILLFILIMFTVAGSSIDAFPSSEADLFAIVDALASYWWIALLGAIPAVYLSIRFTFAQYLLIDKKMGAIEAIKTSWKATAPLQGQIFLFLILILLVLVLGFICFFVGIFVASIVAFYAQAALYRQVFPGGEQDALIVDEPTMVELTKPE